MNVKTIVCAALAAVFALAIIGGCGDEKAPPPAAKGGASGGEAASSKEGDRSKLGVEAGAEKAAPQDLKPQETCPVMGGKITKDVYADYKGQRVYFCCPGCEKTFLNNPEMYLAKMKSQGQKPEQIQ